MYLKLIPQQQLMLQLQLQLKLLHDKLPMLWHCPWQAAP
jgi:hypothetical protein